MEKLLLRPVEAAQLLGIGRTKVYELLAAGELPSIKIGACVRIPVDELRQWIQDQTVGQDHEDIDGAPGSEQSKRHGGYRGEQ